VDPCPTNLKEVWGEELADKSMFVWDARVDFCDVEFVSQVIESRGAVLA